MELPPLLRQAVDRALAGVPLSALTAAAKVLSQRYRGEVRDGRMHLSDNAAALAYLATRLPATYAAIHASLAATARRLPAFAPLTALDVGAGPGTALWAAASNWPGLQDVSLLEASPAIRAWGETLTAAAPVGRISWHQQDIRSDFTATTPCDLVTLAYVLDELSPDDRDRLVDRLWPLTASVLVIVEPGTPKGWQRILAARTRLIAAGANIIAPCPHALTCSLVAPDWCHFAARVARSRVHRLTKEADAPWEDEKYIYLAAARMPADFFAARILSPPESATGRVRLKLCKNDGSVAHRLVTRREGAAFKSARRSDWGDAFEG